MKRVTNFIFIACIFFSFQGVAQAFADEIGQFKKQDRLHPPPKNAILFIGSSTIQKWSDVNNYFPGYAIINRGFGGSTLPDIIFYVDSIIVPYHPRQVIIYCGDNDLASSDSVTADTVFQRFRELFKSIRVKLPGENIVYISIKPSPSRARLQEQMLKANRLIQTFLSHYQHTAFIDVYHKMLNRDGTIMTNIFSDDNLHMNEKGYAIWQKAILPYLSKKK